MSNIVEIMAADRNLAEATPKIAKGLDYIIQIQS